MLPKISLKPSQTVGNENYFEIVGQESPLTNHDKAKIVSHLCHAQPHLMSRWKAELKGNMALGRNYVAISEEGKLLVRESDIPILVFAFDPNKKNALKELMQKMTTELSLSAGLILDLDSARLRIHGPNLTQIDFLKISRFLNSLIEGVSVAHENGKDHRFGEVNQPGFSKSIYNASLLYFTKVHELKESVVFPVSTINILMEYFKLEYRFSYLGEVDSLQIYDGVRGGLNSQHVEDDFYLRISNASSRLGGVDIDELLKSTGGTICREEVSAAVIPKRQKAKL